MNEVIGVDVYNMTTTGGVTMTISGAASDSHHIPTVIIRRTMKEPIVLESNQNHATITQNGVCTTLSASMGLGGGYIPMIVVRRNDERAEVRGS